MVMRSAIVSFAIALSTASCTVTEMPLDHTNPLDRIYDSSSGDFRMALTGESTSSTTAKLTWADAYHKKDGLTTDSNLKLQSTSALLYKTGSPTADDVVKVKAGTLAAGVNGYASVYTIAAVAGSYSGTFTGMNPQNKGTFVIQFNYKYTSKSDVITTGTFYSNFVVLE